MDVKQSITKTETRKFEINMISAIDNELYLNALNITCGTLTI